MVLMLSRVKIKRLPDSPGVYFFQKGKNILYIGKATSLRSRVKSYFARDLIDTRGPLLVKMLSEATRVEHKVTDSVLEALILEAALIKKHQPFYNKAEKDDKSFNYVIITDEEFPRVLIVRGKDLQNAKLKTQNAKQKLKVKNEFGPFPHGLELREAIKIIRKIFPFRDTCEPHFAKASRGKPSTACFNRQIGLCPGVCTGEISKLEYAKVIRSISLFFNGRKSEIIKGLRKHMKQEAKLRNFEKAAELRNKIFALEHINDVALYKRKLDTRYPTERGFRIEGYDIAHISGTHTVGSMVVMEDGILAKHEYKRFKIKGKSKDKSDDVANLTEMLERRFKHNEWRLPDLVVIDGGIAQKSAAEQVVRGGTSNIQTVSVVKNDKHKPDHIMGNSKIVRDYHHDILLVNSEAHRFAINYHRLLRGKVLK